MAVGRGEGKGPGVGKLESQIYCIKYTLFCFNVVLWVCTELSPAGPHFTFISSVYFELRAELNGGATAC